MFIHDSIKLLYANLGYLPGSPYYLISDSEMFDAFIGESGFFDDYYYCPCDDLAEAHQELRQYILDTITKYQSAEMTTLPDWIYSYMLGNCIAFESDPLDLYYLNDLIGVDTTKGFPEFTEETAHECFRISSEWLKKQPTSENRRPATMFGEPHVIKSLRLDQANILINAEGS